MSDGKDNYSTRGNFSLVFFVFTLLLRPYCNHRTVIPNSIYEYVLVLFYLVRVLFRAWLMLIGGIGTGDRFDASKLFIQYSRQLYYEQLCEACVVLCVARIGK